MLHETGDLDRPGLARPCCSAAARPASLPADDGEAGVQWRPAPRATTFRPWAYMAVCDGDRRQLLRDLLHQLGWNVVAVAACHELVVELADFLLGRSSWRRPHLVVADAIAPGLTGLSVVTGLRDLGWSGPAVLLTASPHERAIASARSPAGVILVGPDLGRAVLEPAVVQAAQRAVAVHGQRIAVSEDRN
jgi:CheY-like chemotaxis protein